MVYRAIIYRRFDYATCDFQKYVPVILSIYQEKSMKVTSQETGDAKSQTKIVAKNHKKKLHVLSSATPPDSVDLLNDQARNSDWGDLISDFSHAGPPAAPSTRVSSHLGTGCCGSLQLTSDDSARAPAEPVHPLPWPLEMRGLRKDGCALLSSQEDIAGLIGGDWPQPDPSDNAIGSFQDLMFSAGANRAGIGDGSSGIAADLQMQRQRPPDSHDAVNTSTPFDDPCLEVGLLAESWGYFKGQQLEDHGEDL